MPKKIHTKFWFGLFAVAFLSLLIAVDLVGQIFFVNRTESMPRGIYRKLRKYTVDIGDIVVLHTEHFNGYLLKYIAAKSPSEICITDGEGIFVDDNTFGQQNIEKYQLSQSPICRCEKLKDGELFIIGDHPNSYDSRYFGPIKIENVVATVELLWEFKSAH